VTIYFACEWFVNAVEWLGVQLKVGPIAVGTILAAAGTALPESIVTLVAVLFGSAEHGNDIAVGAAMGGPPCRRHGRLWRDRCHASVA
jgi:cation:H+ antiporter